MKLNDGQINQLEDEISKGNQSEKMYTLYVEPFVTNKRENLLSLFEEISIEDVDMIMEIKRTLKIIAVFEQEFITFIDTGKMASHTISEFMKQQEKH